MCLIYVLKVTYVHVHTCTDDYLPYFRLFISSFSILHSQAMERKIKLMNIPLAVAALITHDIGVLANAHSPLQSTRLRTLFFLKWGNHELADVRTVIEHFRTQWCNSNVTLGNWTHGHIESYANNTNGLESTNNVIKNEVTKRQLMPIINFLLKIQLWLCEQSERRDEANPNYLQFATKPTLTTLHWTKANSWVRCNNKQIRFVLERSTFVALHPSVAGHLTAERAIQYINTFDASSWESYDEFTSMFHNVYILRVDNTRPEGFKCS